jgi:hypothetical protein
LLQIVRPKPNVQSHASVERSAIRLLYSGRPLHKVAALVTYYSHDECDNSDHRENERYHALRIGKRNDQANLYLITFCILADLLPSVNFVNIIEFEAP